MLRFTCMLSIIVRPEVRLQCQDDLALAHSWWVNGRHYSLTLEAWLRRMDAHRRDIMPIMEVLSIKLPEYSLQTCMPPMNGLAGLNLAAGAHNQSLPCNGFQIPACHAFHRMCNIGPAAQRGCTVAAQALTHCNLQPFSSNHMVTQ